MINAAKYNVVKLVLAGYLNRFEAMRESSHPGWRNGPKQREELDRIRWRIMDQVAMCWPEGAVPDRVYVFHDFTIYLLDFAEGEMRLVGTMDNEAPCDLEITQAIEVSATVQPAEAAV